MITAVSMIKNSADIIETMIRANALVADNFVVINNSSTDNTGFILESLVKEGYKIDIFDDDNVSPYQRDRISEAINYAIKTYDPDFILPVDDDEIICFDNEEADPYTLKEYIESLDRDNLYYIRWRNFIPTDEDDLNQVNVAIRERYCLGDEPEMTKKVIIPGKIAAYPDFKIGWGGHFASCGLVKEHVDLAEVRLAHFPIRSSLQIASKVINGWINYLAMPNRDKDLSVHWKVMYKAIKEYGLPTTDTMMTLANLYRERPNDTEHLNVICAPVNIPGEMLKLRYTGNSEINLLKNICENTEKLAAEHARLLEEIAGKA